MDKYKLRELVPLAKRLALARISMTKFKLDKVETIVYRGERKQIYVKEMYELYKKEKYTIEQIAAYYKISPITVRKIFERNFIPTKKMPELAFKLTGREIADQIINRREWPTAQVIQSYYKVSIAQSYRIKRIIEKHYAEVSKENKNSLIIDKFITE